jgi:hypothetical protein
VRDGLTVFAAGNGSDPPDLYMRSASGNVVRLADTADNAVFAGDFLFWTATESEKRVQYGAVYGMRIGTEGCFPVVREDASVNWWHTLVRQPYLRRTLVIYATRFGLARGGGDETLVRVYRL